MTSNTFVAPIVKFARNGASFPSSFNALVVASQPAVTSTNHFKKMSAAPPGATVAEIIVPKALKALPKPSESFLTISVAVLNISLSSPVSFLRAMVLSKASAFFLRNSANSIE